jgi:hemerythrin-like domain-containing protein
MTTAPSFALRARTTEEPEPDLTSIVVIHRAIRQDLRRLGACLGQIAASGAPRSRSHAIWRYTAALLTQIQTHHQNEDEILWPVIAATAGQAIDLAPLTDDHQAIKAAADRASQALASFRAAPGTVAELHTSVSHLRDMLDEHIADEEQQILAAMRRYLPADAYRWCEQQMRRKAALTGLRFTAPWLARHAQPDELNRLLATGGWPARIVLAAARPRYARLERQAFGTSRNHQDELMTSSTDTPSRPAGLVTGAADAAVMIGLAGVEKVYRGRWGVSRSSASSCSR